MAPAGKLSQTRLLKTPRKASIPSSFSAKAKSKTKTKPNQSILSFFKKTDVTVQDESLFIGGGTEVEVEVEIEDREEVGEEEGDIYSAAPAATKEEKRFNENGAAVKRRRLSPSPASEDSSNSMEGQERTSGDSGVDSTGNDKVKVEKLPKPAPKKKRPGNPFLDDESSSDDDDDDKSAPTPATTRVRSPKPFDQNDTEQHHRRGHDRLTNGAVISREVPLLRHETSGADFGNDENGSKERELLQDGDDFGPMDADMFGDDDFTGEELRAMQYMEEQARLEAEEAGEEYIGDDDGEAMTETCPVCSGSLAGATPEQATAHVNSCLDGNPTPLPKPPDSVVDGAAVGKRFARAAVARPGQANPISLGDGAGEGPANSAFTRLMSGHAEDTAWATAAAAENASRGMPAYKRTCPFYKIMPGFSICVDAFRYGAVEGCRAYFLSHFHSDHYIGLTANWAHGPIYCSKVTGSLVKSQLKTAAQYVVELEFEKTVPVPDTNGVTVTMIPANHCPGSSLFLFEKSIGSGGRTQRILHCGDFRACPAHVEHPQLRSETVDAISGKTKQQKIDVCYLDTTYLNPRYSFPPQSDVTNACAELCALLNKSLLDNDDTKWEALLRGKRGSLFSTESVTKFFTTTAASSSSPSLPTPPPNAFTALNPRAQPPTPNRNRLLVVCGTYSIGKERICIAIAKALHTKIYAPPAKLRVCAQLDDPELTSLLTPDPRDAQVHMQPLAELRADTLAEYLDTYRGEFGRVVGFRPSGWTYRPSSSLKNAAKLAPAAVSTTQLLHGDAWRARFGVRDLVPMRGSGTGHGQVAMCFGVPYSEHSSFRELGMFVMALRIEKVVPTVNVGSEGSRRRMRGWIDRWVAERRRGGLVRVLQEGEGERGLWDGKDGKGGGVYW